MIEITPAILTSDLNDFTSELIRYKDFESIDIDITKPPFTLTNSISLENAIETIESIELFKEKSLGFHLMVKNPEEEFTTLKNSTLRFKNIRVYFHQESDNSGYLSTLAFPENWKRCCVIKTESPLVDIEFYNRFDEVQIMTVELGFQGGHFSQSSLQKIVGLREKGYEKMISIDGGVNLETAPFIKEFKPNRVSVGSYFKKSIDLENSKAELNNILNS